MNGAMHPTPTDRLHEKRILERLAFRPRAVCLPEETDLATVRHAKRLERSRNRLIQLVGAESDGVYTSKSERLKRVPGVGSFSAKRARPAARLDVSMTSRLTIIGRHKARIVETTVDPTLLSVVPIGVWMLPLSTTAANTPARKFFVRDVVTWSVILNAATTTAESPRRNSATWFSSNGWKLPAHAGA
jgi:hypothetical protein